MKELINSSPESKELIHWALTSTKNRFSCLERGLAGASGPVTVDTIKSILGSHDPPEYPVCRHKRPGKEAMTNVCTIMELTDSPRLHIASGPPCMTEFTTFEF